MMAEHGSRGDQQPRLIARFSEMVQNAPDPIQKKGENGRWRSEKEEDTEEREREGGRDGKRGLVRAGKRKAVCQGASKPVKKVLEKPVTFWPA